MSAVIRPMEPADVDAVIEHLFLTFSHRRSASGLPARTVDEDVVARQRSAARTRYQMGTDPGGCWVADVGGGEIVGHTIAIRRGYLWGLAMLFVTPGVQSKGLGRRLLAAALSYGRDSEAGIITSSDDPRAIRLYASSGFALRPAMEASGKLHRSALREAPDVRAGSVEDLALTVDVDEHIRGIPHGDAGEDIAQMLTSGGAVLGVIDGPAGRGYVALRDATVELVAATTPHAAQQLLWWALAQTPADADLEIDGLTAAQQWAIEVVLAAGLTITPTGPILTKGRLGPLTPYLPSGHYL